ncbi:8-oxo-dGTP diphosphatase [Paenibacillus doosanensis]|uniref:8-oxo-dGTP diphosphatase n=1 Tax=Paenibacillus konkukensis TaxID=2020716 RepID=A0ABY4RNR2_9BACL|nr:MULTISPECIES: 8-oxo-dGTP diphosphatase [Paenibacillus]MCS7459030.1 8-oxo-dGTP diphosphatase [Paenibacillus doosanensis]UQZ84084.1 8-oxo-dGTP diphosphatase [Paenibacillus konkukensis]
MLNYNLCFIRKEDRVLMINRHHAPLKGMWNGVGGKLEPGETPYDSVIREAWEETGIGLRSARFGGIVTWETDGRFAGGMYVYTADLPEEYKDAFASPAESEEGILAWKAVDWVVQPDNQGIAGHVRHFLPPMLAGAEPSEYRCIFKEGKLQACLTMPLQEESARNAAAGAK